MRKTKAQNNGNYEETYWKVHQSENEKTSMSDVKIMLRKKKTKHRQDACIWEMATSEIKQV